MPETRGFVQKLVLEVGTTSESQACFHVGPSPTDVEVFVVMRRSSDTAVTHAFNSSLVEAVSEAMAARREVVIVHEDSPAITGLRFDTA